jgi:hypothetical protein
MVACKAAQRGVLRVGVTDSVVRCRISVDRISRVPVAVYGKYAEE